MIFLSLLLLFYPIFTLCEPQAHDLTSSYRRLGPRYQVLKEYAFSGQKNARYETRPIQFQDAQGGYSFNFHSLLHQLLYIFLFLISQEIHLMHRNSHQVELIPDVLTWKAETIQKE